ncbi:MAG: nickel pincer cofactor biosynthesis protein LarC [Gemmatimonadetes bacterium]|nr:nickel pincer cofactor biosynthesis protein LarC [Gemmatimonadota bacterium]
MLNTTASAGRALVFDPFAGISGDMILGALLELGLPLPWLQEFVRSLELGAIEVGAERVQRKGIASTRLVLSLPHEHAHRHLSDVVRIIEGTGVASEVQERAVHAFTLLAEAEAEVHGTTRERVHFHEVGALDAIVDVLGVVAACAEMGFSAYYTRPVTLGRGWVEMAHGNFPVPPPAVLKLLNGIPVRDPDFEGECTTPTGAALLQALTGGRAAPTTFTPLATGFGAGTRDPGDRPNCLRLIAIEAQEATSAELLVLQTDIDDLSAEYVPPLIEGVLAAGALDCTVVALLMKKGRTGLRVEALLAPERREAVAAALYTASSSIGYRVWAVQREALHRREETVEWRGQKIRVKRSRLPGGGERAKPEFEDVVRAAAALGMPPFAAYRALLCEGVAAES